MIFSQENVFEENNFPKNAISAGLIYMGAGLEYERLITPAFGVAGGIFAYWTGNMLQWGYMVQGRVYSLHFVPNEVAGGKLDDVLYANVGIGYGESAFPLNKENKGPSGIFTIGVGGKYAVKGPGGFIISPSLNLDMMSYGSVRLRVLFGNSW